MAIYRGAGGAGDATNDITINRVTELTQDAETAATNAASSATSAASSATSASTSATNAATSATASASSATAAASSATTASTAATAAQTAQTAAEAAQTAAETAETNAASSATSAASSATSAATSATNAATSATASASSATASAASASAAATSETNAATSATNAATSATNASTAQTAAEAARDATLAAYDSFDDRYLGAKASDPTVDNDGNALVAGSLYFNTTDGVMKLYNGSAWVAAYVSGADYLAKANNLSDLPSASTALTNLGLTATAAELNTLDGITATVTELNYTDGVTSAIQTQLDAKIDETSATGSAALPAGTTAERDGSPSAGYLRFNTTDGGFEGYDGTEWGAVGGGNTAVVGWENQITVAENYTITTGNNMMSAGPVTIDSGYAVSVPTGSRWVIV